MNLFLHRSPFLLKWIFPNYHWRVNTQNQIIYLTFDDGPIPVVTEFVLETLAQFGAKATFFCIGDNIRKHPEIFQRLLDEGHAVGNHTFNHLNGWKTPAIDYLQNYIECQKVLPSGTNLFRPPYGRIASSQYKLLPSASKVVMWDVLTGDFSPSLSEEECLRKSLLYTRPGSIVVFHDSLKANQNMSFALPRFLAHFAEKGYRFETLEGVL